MPRRKMMKRQVKEKAQAWIMRGNRRTLVPVIVLDKHSDPSLVTVRSEHGTDFRVGRARMMWR